MKMQIQRSMHLTFFLVVLTACEVLSLAEESVEQEDSMTSSKKSFDDAFDRENEDQQAFLNAFEQEMDEAIGADGEVEVAKLESSECPCKQRKFLDQVFIHADGEMGSFICKPCHFSCTADCSGPAGEDCAPDMEDVAAANLVERRDVTHPGLSSPYARSFRNMVLSIKQEANLDGLSFIAQNGPEDAEKCVEDHSCNIEDVKVIRAEQYGKVEKVDVKIVAAGGNASGKDKNLVNPRHLVGKVQKQIREANKAVGMLPDVVKKVEFNNVKREAFGEGDDKGKVEKEFKQALLIQSDEEQCMNIKLQRLNSSKVLTDRTKSLLLGMAQDNVNIAKKKKAQNFAKESLKAMLGPVSDDCLEAVDMLVGVSQVVYSCWSKGQNDLSKGLCSPKDKFAEAKVFLKSAAVNADFVKVLAKKMEGVKMLGKMLQIAGAFATSVEEWTKKHTEGLNGMLVQDQGVKKEDLKCCGPSPGVGCEAGEGAKYKCAGCSAGKMCSQNMACNTVQGMEDKVNAWKDEQYDTFLINVAEAATASKKGAKSTNPDSTLAKQCKITKCKDLRDIVKKMIGATKKFVEKTCPWKAPKKGDFVSPKMRHVHAAIKRVTKTVKALQWFGRVLKKEVCFNVPTTKKRIEKKCDYICVPCCTFVGNQQVKDGQKEGKLKCHTCCHDVCYDVTVTTGTIDRKCCSGKEILQGESDIPAKSRKGVEEWYKSKVNKYTKKLQKHRKSAMKLLKKAKFGKWKFPKLPKMDLKLPTFPQRCPQREL